MFKLSIITPTKVVFEEDVISLTAPGDMGFFEVLSHHAPLMATLKEGEFIVIDHEKKRLSWHIKGGFFEFNQNKATLLADDVS